MEEHRKMLQKIVKKDQKRRKRIEAAGIEYECPELVSFRLHNSIHYIFNIELITACFVSLLQVGNTQPVPKRIKFSEED